jgi:transcriptional regulator with XRE-family HTH domain
MSQRDLAAASGVAHATISRIESGKQTASFVTRRKLAAALQTTADKIDFDSPSPSKSSEGSQRSL